MSESVSGSIVDWDEAERLGKLPPDPQPGSCYGKYDSKDSDCVSLCNLSWLCIRNQAMKNEAILEAASKLRELEKQVQEAEVETPKNPVVDKKPELLSLPGAFSSLQSAILGLEYVGEFAGKRMIAYRCKDVKFLAVKGPVTPEQIMLVFYGLALEQIRQVDPEKLSWLGIDGNPKLVAMYVRPHEQDYAAVIVKHAYSLMRPKIDVFLSSRYSDSPAD